MKTDKEITETIDNLEKELKEEIRLNGLYTKRSVFLMSTINFYRTKFLNLLGKYIF